MPDDVLRVGSEFDPGGILSGLQRGVAGIVAFEKRINHLSQTLVEDFKGGFFDELKVQLDQIRATTETTDGAVNSMSRKFSQSGETGGAAFKKLERGLTGIALQVTQTSGAVGQLAESFALGVGGPELLVGVAAAVAAYGLLTKTTREATEAREKLAKAGAQRVLSNQPQTTQISLEVAAAEERRALAAREALQIQRELGSTIDGFVFALADEYRQRVLNKGIAEDTRTVEQGILDIKQQQTNADVRTHQFVQQQQQARVEALGAAPELGTDTAAGMRERAAELQRLSGIVHDHTVSLLERNEAEREYELLRTAMHFKELTYAAAEFDATERRKQAYQDLLSTLDRLAAGAAAQTRASPGNINAKALLDQRDRVLAPDVQQQKDFNDALERGFRDAQSQLPIVERAFDDLDRTMQQTDGTWRTITHEVEDHRTALEKLHDSISVVVDGTRGIVQAANRIGLIGQAAAQSIDSVLNLADALNQIALFGATTGNVLGAVGAGIGLIGAVGSAVGSDPLEQEHLQLLRQNNDRLAELRLSMDASLQGAQGLSATGGVLQTQNIFANVGGQLRQSSDLTQALADAGLSLEEFAKLVEQQTGIQILDSEGHLVAGSFQQARDAVDQMTKAALHFGTSLADIETQIATHAKLFGGSDLGQNRDVLLAGLNLDPGLEGRIAALDLETEAGRKAYFEFLKQLYNMAAAGQLTAEQLGKFTSLEDLLAVLGQGADDTKTADQEAADAAREKAQADKDAADAAKELAAQQRAAGIAAGQNIISRQSILEQLQGATASIADRLRAQVIGTAVGASGDTGTQTFLGNVGSTNFEDPAIRDAFRKKLIGWIEAANAGQLTADQLGLTDDQFMQFLQNAADSLNALDQAAADAAKAQRDQAREMENLHSRLVGDPQDAVGNFQRELDILSQSIPELSGAFDGLDLSSGANADAIRQKLLELFDQVGNIDPALKDEFLSFLGLGADALDELTKSANDATKSLTNVPQGLNLAEFEWRARMAAPPGGRSSSITGIHFTDPIGGGTPPFQRGTDGAMQPMLTTGPIQITIQGSDKSPQEIAKEVVRELSRVGMNRRGVPSGTVGLG